MVIAIDDFLGSLETAVRLTFAGIQHAAAKLPGLFAEFQDSAAASLNFLPHNLAALIIGLVIGVGGALILLLLVKTIHR